jgi:hypothetical protein
MQEFRGWPIYTEIPVGWSECKIMAGTLASPLPNCIFITDGISPLKGGNRALLQVKSGIKRTNAELIQHG